MKKLLFLAAMCIAMLSLQPAGVYAQDTDGKYKEALSKMLDKSGGLEAVKQIMPNLVSMIKKQSAQQPDSFWDDFTKRWTQQFIGKMVEGYMPIYRKYLTLEDLEKIQAFYDTPVGKKIYAATPFIIKEGMEMGQRLGMEITQQMQGEIAGMASK